MILAGDWMHIRVFLSRWRRYRPCPECDGARLRPAALATRVGGRNIADISRMKIRDAAREMAETGTFSFAENAISDRELTAIFTAFENAGD